MIINHFYTIFQNVNSEFDFDYYMRMIKLFMQQKFFFIINYKLITFLIISGVCD